MKKLKLLLTSIAIIVFAACSGANKQEFIGCYALQEDGQAELKITYDGDKAYVSITKRDGWSKPEGLHVGTIEELKPLFGSDAERIKSSLISDKEPFGIFQVTPGEVYGGQKAETEYLAFVIFGGGPVYKVDCQ